MATQREKVVVAMSGGVDSSVAACLLAERGFDVVGLFMRVGVSSSGESDPRVAEPARSQASGSNDTSLARAEAHDSAAEDIGGPLSCDRTKSVPAPVRRLKQGCCSASDAADARFVAGMLGVPFYALNFEADFDRLIDDFADEYARGRTPNPCVVCNDRFKFGRLLEYADAVGARYIATGHYARIDHRDGDTALLRGVDASKDQSYVLFGLSGAVLDRVMFPVGELTKTEVRAIARRLRLPNQDKPDSVEICFVPDQDYARVVKARRPDAFVGGEVRDEHGTVIGHHQGLPMYTIGQRRGLGIATGKPIYVTHLDPATNTITVGARDRLLARSLTADRANLLVNELPPTFRADVKIRYLHQAAAACVTMLGGNRIRVEFDQPQRAITPGQAVVLYDGDRVLGGAWIERADHKAPTLSNRATTPAETPA